MLGKKLLGGVARKRYGLKQKMVSRLYRISSILLPTPLQMARYAARHTEFYRRFYSSWDRSAFNTVPVLEKRMIKEVPPFDLLSDEYADSVVIYGETTGSSGSPTPAFYTGGELKGATQMAYISPYFPLLREVIAQRRVCLNGLAFGFTIAGLSFDDLLRNLGGLVANVGSRSTLATPERIARAIVRLRPSVIAATPIDFLSWMRIVEEDYPGEYPGVVSKLRLLLSTAELCSQSRCKQIGRHFDLVHIDVYACVEGFFTLPCPCGEKHILDIYHVELFDSQLRRSTRGQGRLAFTNLHRRSTPMIRYLLDDWVTLVDSSCPHGFKLSVIPHGRTELNVRIGESLLNVEPVEEAIFEAGLFGDWRLEVHEDRLVLTLESYAADEEAARKAIAGIEARYDMEVQLELVPFGQLTRYRDVRREKPIHKVRDTRSSSTQEVPEYL